ncbi:HGGxSTG domain-containing protein [Bradyrhizobium sp. DASA03120]|uniref:HGGxSTG domain-containing protein n=1 Tax=Bradyrhizobium sp. SMVTL-02 TaxID=3395917 RepID=UPI003F7305E2
MTGAHARNTAPMQSSPRCGARTRDGGTCRAPARHGKERCRMHGGAQRSGARKGNENALKHGLFTRAARAEAGQVRLLLDEAQRLLEELK